MFLFGFFVFLRRNHKKKVTMKKVFLLMASTFVALSCTNTKIAHADEADREATRESASAILDHMPGWVVADSSWWSHGEQYQNVTLERVHLHLITTKGGDTLYVETSEFYGSDYMSGIVRYPSNFDTPLSEKQRKNNIIKQIFGRDSCFRIEIYPDSSMSAVFTYNR